MSLCAFVAAEATWFSYVELCGSSRVLLGLERQKTRGERGKSAAYGQQG